MIANEYVGATPTSKICASGLRFRPSQTLHISTTTLLPRDASLHCYEYAIDTRL